MSTGQESAGEGRDGPWADALVFGLFVAICLGLGYATLARYDAREHGNVDARHYHAMIEGSAVQHPTGEVFRARILVPALARVLLPAFEGRVGTWSPTALALLVVNSLFVAGTASLLVSVARRTHRRRDVALVAALLYLASFAITNFHLAGHVDSAEGFCFMAVVWACASERWWWLVAIAALGAAAKEAVVPLSMVLVATWIWAVRRGGGPTPPRAPLIVSALVGIAAFATVRRVVLGEWVLPWDVAETMARPSLLAGLGTAFDRTTLYVFAWLLPLGLVRVRDLPVPWRTAAIAGVLASIVLAVWAHGTAVRLAFDLAGPLLALSCALLLLDGPRPRAAASATAEP